MAVIGAQKERFLTLNSANNDPLSFEKECMFAKQQLEKNSFSMKVAAGNQNSLQASILNVAAIGISLNPASQHAYLVPRSGAICLDISFQGLRKIATDSGAIEWAKVELVYKNDTFKYKGPITQPDHEADPFSDRGSLVGGYCIARLPSGEFMIEVMNVDEINKVRDTSKASKNGPWVNWYDEMAKKTILKRAFKQWPQSAKTPNERMRLESAVSVSHESEGTAYTLEEHAEYMKYFNSGQGLEFYLMRCRTSEEVWNALYNSFEKGQKVKNKQHADSLEASGVEIIGDYVTQLNDAVENNDVDALTQLVEELNTQEMQIIRGLLPPASIETLDSLAG